MTLVAFGLSTDHPALARRKKYSGYHRAHTDRWLLLYTVLPTDLETFGIIRLRGEFQHNNIVQFLWEVTQTQVISHSRRRASPDVYCALKGPLSGLGPV